MMLVKRIIQFLQSIRQFPLNHKLNSWKHFQLSIKFLSCNWSWNRKGILGETVNFHLANYHNRFYCLLLLCCCCYCWLWRRHWWWRFFGEGWKWMRLQVRSRTCLAAVFLSIHINCNSIEFCWRRMLLWFDNSFRDTASQPEKTVHCW